MFHFRFISTKVKKVDNTVPLLKPILSPRKLKRPIYLILLSFNFAATSVGINLYWFLIELYKTNYIVTTINNYILRALYF
jgi:hypothetical protein